MQTEAIVAAAALIGALIGALSGVVGQIVTERLRQKGERRHQNRLLLEATYAQAIRHISEVLTQRPPKNPVDLDERARFVREFGHTAATVAVAGSMEAIEGIDKITRGLSDDLALLRMDGFEPETRRRQVRRELREWCTWTLKVIRGDLEIETPPGKWRLIRKRCRSILEKWRLVPKKWQPRRPAESGPGPDTSS